MVSACLADDRRAQKIFYHRYAPVALRICRKYVSDKHEAVDILNGGMMKVFEKLYTFEWNGSLEGWVKRVVFRHSIDHIRKKKSIPVLEINDWNSPQESRAIQSLYVDDLSSIIDLLPEKSKEVFWLFAVEGYSHQEIALKLGFSVGNSRWHLNKARKILQNKLTHSSLKENRHAG